MNHCSNAEITPIRRALFARNESMARTHFRQGGSHVQKSTFISTFCTHISNSSEQNASPGTCRSQFPLLASSSTFACFSLLVSFSGKSGYEPRTAHWCLIANDFLLRPKTRIL